MNKILDTPKAPQPQSPPVSPTNIQMPITMRKSKSVSQQPIHRLEGYEPVQSSKSYSQQLEQNEPGRMRDGFSDDYRDVRFSRFSAWHLTHMVENGEVMRGDQLGGRRQEGWMDQEEEESWGDEGFQYTLLAPQKYRKSPLDKQFSGFNSPRNNPSASRKERRPKPKQTGLRKLSGKAYRIVKQLGQATYKQVASILIKEIVNDQSEFDDEKEENNIKRRVYDALNVLIAMDILSKWGKNISYGPGRKGEGVSKEREKERLKNSIRERQALIQQKRKLQRQQTLKLRALTWLANRNKFRPTVTPTPSTNTTNNTTNNQIGLQLVYVQVNSMDNITLSEDRQQCTAMMDGRKCMRRGVDLVGCLVGRRID